MDKLTPTSIADQKELFCGLIMPLAEFDNCSASHWDEVRSIIADAVEKISEPRFRARMVSDGDETGIIHRRIIQNVYADPIAICDVSGRNPNVLFELGMRVAFDKPIVIVKDDKTPFMFDTGMIEHLTYPRDLRHGAMELFKAQVTKKVANTYSASMEKPDSVSFIKSFGPFKTVSLEEVKEPADKAILTMLTDLQGQVSRLSNSISQERNAVASDRKVSPGLPPPRRPRPVGKISDMPLKLKLDMKKQLEARWEASNDIAEVIEYASKSFSEIKAYLGEDEFDFLVRQLLTE
jgi:hypothetical protein